MSLFVQEQETPLFMAIKVLWLRALSPNNATLFLFLHPHESQPSFSSSETEFIREFSIHVQPIQVPLFSDDTLATLKLKISTAWKETSLDELLLFGRKEIQLRYGDLFQLLTKRGKTILLTSQVASFLLNIVSDDVRQSLLQSLPTSRTMTFEQLRDLPWPSEPVLCDVFLGNRQELVPVTCNPFVALAAKDEEEAATAIPLSAEDRVLDQDQTDLYRLILTSTNNQVLLQSGALWNDMLFCCSAQDVLESTNSPEDQERLIRRFFPFLFHQNITSLDLLEETKPELLEKQQQFIQETETTFRILNLFHDISQNGDPASSTTTSAAATTPLPYSVQGIRMVHCMLHTNFNTTLPLDSLFKQLHSTQQRPLVQFHPAAANQDYLCRLFTGGQLSTDGRKIPQMPKQVIYRVAKTLGSIRKKSALSFYVTVGQQEVFCFCDSVGQLTAKVEFDVPQSLQSVDALLQLIYNTLLSDVCAALQLPETNARKFSSLQDDHVEILSLSFESKLDSLPAFSVQSDRACVAVIFSPERALSSASSSELLWNARLKRVGNYNEANAQQRFIMDAVHQQLTRDTILKGLQEQFPSIRSATDAETLLSSVLADLEVVETNAGDTRLQSNPGFPCTLRMDKSTHAVSFLVENINDVGFLSTIPIYLDALLRIWLSNTSGKFVSKEQFNQLKSLCGRRGSISTAKEQQEEKQGEEAEEAREEEDTDIDLNLLQPSLPAAISSAQDFSTLFFQDSSSSDTSSSNQKSDEDEDEHASKSGDDDMSIGFGGASKEQEEEEEDNDSSEEELSETEGPENPESTKNVEGLKINKPYYFQRRMEEYDQVLISKQSDRGKSNTYSRSCSSTLRKQPVVLTDEELASIQNQYPNFLRKEDVIRYGSDPSRQQNYICPRFWCLKYNTIVDPKDLVKDPETGEWVHQPKNGQPSCGRVMKATDTEVRDPYYIYEFHGEGKRYPGLMHPSLPHPVKPGLCYPCCFTKHEGESLNRRQTNASCMNAMNGPANVVRMEEELEKPAKESSSKAVSKDVDYIKAPEKFPLDPLRWGYLQPALQLLFRDMEGVATCSVRSSSSQLSKLKGECLLRHGVVLSERQSFVACLADALSFADQPQVLSLAETRKRLKDAVSFDQFVTLQNGNLVTDFFDPDPTAEDKENEEPETMEAIRSSKLYQRLHQSTPAQQLYLQRASQAFRRFRAFLLDPESDITPTYLWDLIATKNNALFPQGVNLVILELPMDDITGKVQVVCPSNHYARSLYDPKKPSLVLVQQDQYYEPIYLFREREAKGRGKEKEIHVQKLFSETDKNPAVRALLKRVVKPLLYSGKGCRPIPTFQGKHAILLYDLLEQLFSIGYRVHAYLMNLQGKIIAVQSSKHRTRGLVPCYPTALLEDDPGDIPVVFLDDKKADDMWLPYAATVRFLTTLHKRSNRRIPCRPLMAILEEMMIVGVLTETDQFLQVSKPENPQDVPSKYALPLLANAQNASSADVLLETATTTDKDERRVQYMQRLQAETKLFNLFRHTMRTLLNKPEAANLRQQLQSFAQPLSGKPLLYNSKLERARDLLVQASEDAISFRGTEKQFLGSNTPDQTICQNDQCQLLLPKRNLLTGRDNRTLYFGRLADELIRYTRINQFFFQPESVLSLSKVEYNLRWNEMLLMKSLLTPSYLDSLIPATSSEFIKQNAYDQVEPQPLSVVQASASSVRQLQQQQQPMSEDEEQSTSSSASSAVLPPPPVTATATTCRLSSHRILQSAFWKESFNDFCGEILYSKSVVCAYQWALDWLRQAGKKGVQTVEQLKQELVRGYSSLWTKYQNKIIHVMMAEGKRELGEQLLTGRLTLEDAIHMDTYFLTPLDVWMLAQSFQIPLMFLSQNGPLTLSAKQLPAAAAYVGSDTSVFFFVLVQPHHERIPSFSFVVEWPEEWLQPEQANQPVQYAPLKQHSQKDLREFVADSHFQMNFAEKVVGRGARALEEAVTSAQTVEQFLDQYRVAKRAVVFLEEDEEEEEEQQEQEKAFLVKKRKTETEGKPLEQREKVESNPPGEGFEKEYLPEEKERKKLTIVLEGDSSEEEEA